MLAVGGAAVLGGAGLEVIAYCELGGLIVDVPVDAALGGSSFGGGRYATATTTLSTAPISPIIPVRSALLLYVSRRPW